VLHVRVTGFELIRGLENFQWRGEIRRDWKEYQGRRRHSIFNWHWGTEA